MRHDNGIGFGLGFLDPSLKVDDNDAFDIAVQPYFFGTKVIQKEMKRG